MEKLRTVIVDDNEDNLMLVEHYLNEYCGNDTLLVGKANSKKSAIEIIDKLKPELLILDIELGDGNGFEVLEKIHIDGLKTIITTAHDEFAIKAFKYRTIDYILKPIQITDLTNAIKMITTDMHGETEMKTGHLQTDMTAQSIDKDLDFIAVVLADKIKLVKLKKILYLNSSGRYTIINLNDGTKLISVRNLGEYEDILNGIFYRTHHEYIVNLKKVTNIQKEGYCVMCDGSHIPISKRKEKQLREYLKI